MQILLVYQGGRREEGLLLAGSPERMRVMIPGRADVTEFRLIEGDWMTESGPVVEIGAIQGQEAHSATWFQETIRPQVRLAI